MAHSYTGNFVHCVFSTKGRKEIIPPKIQETLWAYFVGIARNLNVPILAAGGTANHVHLLFSLPATLPLAAVIQKFKANSSRWMGERGIYFAWQVGYGAFSVSPSMLSIVKAYIQNQPEHHKKRGFEDEFSAWLRKSGVLGDHAFVVPSPEGDSDRRCPRTQR